MAVKKKIDTERIATAKEALKKICVAVEKQSLTTTLQSLKTEIKMARKAGRTWGEIANTLTEAGVETSASMLAIKFKPKATKPKQDLKQREQQRTKQEGTNKEQAKAQVPTFNTGTTGTSGAYFEIKPDSEDL